MAHTPDFESNAQQPERYLQLVVHAGPLAGKGFPITGNVMTFGRDPDNDICLSDDFVSRHHARIVRQGSQIILEDFGSANGTKINGKEVVGTQVVQPSDVISIGSSVFGIKGFSAPSTVGMTQVSSQPPQSMPASLVVARPPSAPQVMPQQQNQSKSSFLVIGGVAALIIVVIIVALFSLYFMSSGTVTANIPAVIITAPLEGGQIQAGQLVTVQAIASDPDGVVRAELWVRGLKVAETISPSASGQPTLTSSFQWNAETAGSYILEIRAYNKRGAVNTPTLVTVNVVSGVVESSPTATLAPVLESTAIQLGGSVLTTLADLRVRSGPGIEYDLLGILPTNIKAEIIGQDEARQWWQIRFVPAADDIGWVVADVIFSTATNIGNVPITISPPTPTGTPTLTLTPTPTSTPTSTSVPATGTPLPTNTSIPPTNTAIPTDTPTIPPTATPVIAVTTIEFNVSPTSINAGKCVLVTWYVSGVKEIHINDVGVGGSGSYEDCPLQTKTYTILVLKKDGATYTQEIIVNVNNSQNQVLSSGVIVIGANQTVDFDSGVSPGDDFLWYVNVNGRRFEAQGNVKLSPQSDISSLNNLSRADCAKALFGVYSSIDASDNPIDPTNALIPGRSACYKTNSGRLGKMRFPEKSVDSLKVEWLTWE